MDENVPVTLNTQPSSKLIRLLFAAALIPLQDLLPSDGENEIKNLEKREDSATEDKTKSTSDITKEGQDVVRGQRLDVLVGQLRVEDFEDDVIATKEIERNAVVEVVGGNEVGEIFGELCLRYGVLVGALVTLAWTLAVLRFTVHDKGIGCVGDTVINFLRIAHSMRVCRHKSDISMLLKS